MRAARASMALIVLLGLARAGAAEPAAKPRPSSFGDGIGPVSPQETEVAVRRKAP